MQEETEESSSRKLYPIFYLSPASGKPQGDVIENRTPSRRKRIRDIATDNNEDQQATPKQLTPRRRIQLPTATRKSKEQLYLDLGQNYFGHVECDKCGMIYTNGQIEDALVHCKFHKRLNNKIMFKGWKDERVVERYSDGRVLIVLPSDSKQHIKKVDEVLTVVDSELGYIGFQSHVKSKAKSFLFISNRKEVIGYVMAEEISKAYELNLSNDDKENDSSLTRESWLCSDIPKKAVLGIMCVWVSANYRRKGVATRLLDAVRKHFIFAYTVSKTLLAFSDPTPDGRALAVHYCGDTNSVLVYKWTVQQ